MSINRWKEIEAKSKFIDYKISLNIIVNYLMSFVIILNYYSLNALHVQHFEIVKITIYCI